MFYEVLQKMYIFFSFYSLILSFGKKYMFDLFSYFICDVSILSAAAFGSLLNWAFEMGFGKVFFLKNFFFEFFFKILRLNQFLMRLWRAPRYILSLRRLGLLWDRGLYWADYRFLRRRWLFESPLNLSRY